MDLKQIKQETLEELQGLYDWADDSFTNPKASPDKPLSYQVVTAIWWDALDKLEEAEFCERRDHEELRRLV